MARNGPSWIETDRLSSLVELTAWRRPALATERPSAADVPVSRFGVTHVTNATIVTPRYEAPTSQAPVPPVVGRIAFEGELEARLERLLKWSVSMLGATAAFVTDDEGLVMAATDETALEPAATTTVEVFLRQWSAYASRPDGFFALRADGRTHVVTWAQHAGRTYFLVVSGARHDDRASAAQLSEALESALESNER